MDRYEISELNLGKNEYICFEIFEFSVLHFSLKEEIMRNIHNHNVTELAYYVIAFYTQRLGTCLGDTGILVKPSLFHLI